jgi:DNA-binding transcriptional LysR family regulator
MPLRLRPQIQALLRRQLSHQQIYRRHLDTAYAHSQQASGGRDQIRNEFSAAGIFPQVVAQALHRSTMIMLAASGVAVTFVAAAVAEVAIPGLIFRKFQIPRLSIGAAFRANAPPGLAMQFLRTANQVLGTSTSDDPS